MNLPKRTSHRMQKIRTPIPQRKFLSIIKGNTDSQALRHIGVTFDNQLLVKGRNSEKGKQIQAVPVRSNALLQYKYWVRSKELLNKSHIQGLDELKSTENKSNSEIDEFNFTITHRNSRAVLWNLPEIHKAGLSNVRREAPCDFEG